MDDSPTAGRVVVHTTRRACTFCQNRHLKCDGTQPCTQCERRQLECIFQPVVQSKRSNAKRTAEDESSGHSDTTKWRPSSNNDDSETAVFQLDGDDPDSTIESRTPTIPPKRRKRKLNAQPSSSYRDSDAELKTDASNIQSRPRFSLVGNGHGPSGFGHMKPSTSHIQDSMHDASTALTQLSSTPMTRTQLNHGSYDIQGGQSASSLGQTSHLGNSGVQSSHLHSTSTGFGNPSYSGHSGISGAMQLSAASSKTVSATNAWMVAFSQGVSPYTSTAPFSPLDPLELQRVLLADKEHQTTFPLEIISKAFMQCAMLAHGSRYTGNIYTASQHGSKAWQLLKTIMRPLGAHTQPALAQHIVTGMELLFYFYLGQAEFYKVRTIAAHAYYVLTLHRKHLVDATAHRILGIQIGTSASLDDVEFWLAKAKALNLQATTPFETSGWVVLALMLTGEVMSTSGNFLLPYRAKQLSEREFTHKIAVLQVVDESEKAVAFFETTQACQSDATNIKVCKIHKAVLNGCRALVLWQAGYDSEAMINVNKILSSGKPDTTSRLPHMVALSWAAQVARCLGHATIVTRFIEYLEEGSAQYDLIRFYLDELRAPVGSTNSHPGVLDENSEMSGRLNHGTEIKHQYKVTKSATNSTTKTNNKHFFNMFF